MAALVVGQGCSQQRNTAQAPMESPYGGRRTVIVVPMQNVSQFPGFDPLKVTDLFYSEVQQVKGFAVIPINRLLAEMEASGQREVRSVGQLASLGQRLGADAVILFAVTEYNPYHPPAVTVVCQLFLLENKMADATTRPAQATTRPARAGPAAQPVLVAEVTEVFNAAHEAIVKRVREFAEERDEQATPYGWRIYLEDQRLYLRFVFNQVIQSLLRSERARLHGGMMAGREVRS